MRMDRVGWVIKQDSAAFPKCWWVFKAPWRVLLNTRALQHLFFGVTVILMLLWSMRAGISPGLSIHFLGLTVLTLILGWDLAILSATLVLLAMTVIGKESWDGFTVNGLCLILLPALVTHWIRLTVERYLPKNFFVYLFGCGFLGAGVVVALSGLCMVMFLWLDGVYPWAKIHHEYINYLPLIMFPEALLNGILLTGVMVFYPDWIRTFDAKVYIDDQ
jgi:uncharacterized membrane protein